MCTERIFPFCKMRISRYILDLPMFAAYAQESRRQFLALSLFRGFAPSPASASSGLKQSIGLINKKNSRYLEFKSCGIVLLLAPGASNCW